VLRLKWCCWGALTSGFCDYWLWWLLGQVVVPLLRNSLYLYVTESEPYRQEALLQVSGRECVVFPQCDVFPQCALKSAVIRISSSAAAGSVCGAAAAQQLLRHGK
jgi:hypothetical protein